MIGRTSRTSATSATSATSRRARRGSSARSGAGSDALSPELHRAQELLLAAVAEGGTARLAHICLDAWDGGDAVAAGMSLGALLRAVPGMGPLTAHEILAHLRATEATLVGELDHAQRVALPAGLARARRPSTAAME
ncbi:hypothetical protein [Streptacidiphilus jiangxiensis]|uniref:Uncharacterized protein n=1 Tax=Streptacidiphilus jiangxiensis TaxID=235985 RepID=A0A1H7V5H7_STRJI|nr:hypothetical protein [Streptacidiphilus jiangxiensis]SEM04340.1 hypothetical protein SAMN05414137_11792 [Streptacidiphilus jiangxiensis]